MGGSGASSESGIGALGDGAELGEVEYRGFGDGAVWVGLFHAPTFGAGDDHLSPLGQEPRGDGEGERELTLDHDHVTRLDLGYDGISHVTDFRRGGHSWDVGEVDVSDFASQNFCCIELGFGPLGAWVIADIDEHA